MLPIPAFFLVNGNGAGAWMRGIQLRMDGRLREVQ
jgi:hypothetical protein